jgi:two-component system nitrogen regulation response regulator NtrX
LIDVHFPEGSGIDFYERLVKEKLELPTLLISGAASAAEAVRGVKLGIYDYLEKPLSADRLRLSVKRCLEHFNQKVQLATLTNPLPQEGQILGSSKAMEFIREQVGRFAQQDVKVLITGETGTGKEVVAQSLWRQSDRSSRTLIVVNAAAIPENLVESELFGHRKGSFTGATHDRIGKIEMAHGGTLFLDEIGDLSLPVQSKLLRFLENDEVQRVGDNQVKKVDVRVIAATSKNLEHEVEQGRFRSDLYYRLNVARIQIPPLREHVEDIEVLFPFFLERKYERSPHLSKAIIEKSAMEALQKYSWHGNVRELRNVADRILLLAPKCINGDLMVKVLGLANLSPGPASKIEGESAMQTFLPFKEYKLKMEDEYLQKVLHFVGGSITQAAQVLKIDRSYLHQKLNNLKKAQSIVKPS